MSDVLARRQVLTGTRKKSVVQIEILYRMLIRSADEPKVYKRVERSVSSKFQQELYRRQSLEEEL